VAERCESLGADSCECLACDLSDPASIDKLAADVLKRCDGIDVLVSNAGMAADDNNVETGERVTSLLTQGACDPGTWRTHVNRIVCMCAASIHFPVYATPGDPDEWDKMLAINSMAPMRLTRLFVFSMVKRGGGLIM
jgi:NAD(P)-dependent dehydrogenase (short-subunit alcohol dehydrogenase family)